MAEIQAVIEFLRIVTYSTALLLSLLRAEVSRQPGDCVFALMQCVLYSTRSSCRHQVPGGHEEIFRAVCQAVSVCLSCSTRAELYRGLLHFESADCLWAILQDWDIFLCRQVGYLGCDQGKLRHKV